ncbi:MAG: stage IV sporulation protein A [Oscillospiraceae bacterium]|nr:stage IV sporulation protein A [Oscillospiraceae bacterium]
MEENRIYDDIAERTNGNIYLGIVGPVRTGKSTFIKRFMETLVIPNMSDVYMKERARDELPQSGSGKTIMTAEPKFVPEEAIELRMENAASLSVRLVDCVGYMVDGALGQFEGDIERMVTTPWFDHEITMAEAAEIGTRKVIAEHSTIGIVITTDGSVTEIPRESYLPAEERVIQELREIGKPFVILLNAQNPRSPATQELRRSLEEKYGVTVRAVNCMELDEAAIAEIIQSVLREFPVSEFGIFLPPWVDALPFDHPIRVDLFETIRECAGQMRYIRDVAGVVAEMGQREGIRRAGVRRMHLGSGIVHAELDLPRELFYETLSKESGFAIRDDGDLMGLLTEMAHVKTEYDKISHALDEVRTRGYGVVLPTRDQLCLEEPEIVKQGGRYGVRLKASAPSIHMIAANIETEVSPAVGGEKSSEEIINFLLQEFEGDVSRIWESNIFGKSLYDIASEGLTAKIKKMPEDAQGKLQETLQRIINEGSGGLICIIL